MKTAFFIVAAFVLNGVLVWLLLDLPPRRFYAAVTIILALYSMVRIDAIYGERRKRGEVK